MTTSLEYQSTSHTIRAFQPGDRTGFLSLYETVFDDDHSSEWFHWKYEANPFIDHVPIIVATFDGEIVGCRSFFALEMSVDGNRVPALQPCDTMVHPDHQRQGLFTRMTELALEQYADGPQQFCFNFPNAQSKPGNESLGWKAVATVPMHYRPQNPATMAKTLVSGEHGDDPNRRASTVKATLDRAMTAPIVRTHRTCDRVLERAHADVSVDRHDQPPAETLAAIASRSVPDGIHTARTERFYRWRLANPQQEYVTYVASQNGTPVAALIVSPQRDHVRIVDALPRAIDSHRRALETLLVSVLASYTDRAYITAFGQVLPRPTPYRFVADTGFPVSSLVRPTARTLYAKTLASDRGVEGTSETDWTLSRLDLDTA